MSLRACTTNINKQKIRIITYFKNVEDLVYFKLNYQLTEEDLQLKKVSTDDKERINKQPKNQGEGPGTISSQKDYSKMFDEFDI